MKNRLITTIKTLSMTIFISVFLATCGGATVDVSATATAQQRLKEEIARQKSFYAGYFRSCEENYFEYTTETADAIYTYCKNRLGQAVDDDFYTNGATVLIAPFTKSAQDFNNIYEYQFHRGIWSECYVDVTTMSQLTGTQLLDFCNNVIIEAITKKWSIQADARIPAFPEIKLKIENTEG